MKEKKEGEQVARGKIIVIEGLDGSGKGTVIESLKLALPSDRVFFYREPGGTEMGEKIRQILLDAERSDVHYFTETLLFYASRNEGLQAVVGPKLDAGLDGIFDRFNVSTEVFQFLVNGLGHAISQFRIIDHLVVGNYQPDLTLFLDVEPAEAIRRIRSGSRPDEMSRFDAKPLGYHQKVRAAYFEALKSKNHVVVDTNSQPGESIEQTIERVKREALKIVTDFLNIP